MAIDYSAHPKAGLYFVGPDAGYPEKPQPDLLAGGVRPQPLTGSRAGTRRTTAPPPRWSPPSSARLRWSATAGCWRSPTSPTAGGPTTGRWTSPTRPIWSRWRSATSPGSRTSGAASRSSTTSPPASTRPPPAAPSATRRRSSSSSPRPPAAPTPTPSTPRSAVVDYMWGGMENISATTQTARTLHTARADHDSPSEGLVAHETAHQWFGDLLTCEDWSNAWLNEGFADYFTALYMRSRPRRGRLRRRDRRPAQRLSPRGRAGLPAADRHQALRRPDRHVRPPHLRQGGAGAPHDPPPARRGGLVEGDPRLRRALRRPDGDHGRTSRTPSRRPPASPSARSSTATSTAPAIPS